MEKLRRNPLYLFLLPAALMLISFTSLRIPGTKIGPGEVTLALWILITFVFILKDNVPFNPLAKKTAVTLGIMIASSFIGSVWSFLTVYMERDQLPFSIEESINMILVFFTCVAFAFIADKCYAVRTTAIYCVMTSAFYLVYYLFFFDTQSRWGPRMTVWANNPNQTALNCMFIYILSLMLFMRKETKFRILYLVTAYIGYITGLATASDGFKMGVYASLVLIAVALVIRNYRKAILWIAVAGAVVVVLFFVDDILLWLQDYVDSWSYSGQDEGRYALWRWSFVAFLNSPIFGNGMAGHSGMTAAFLGSDAHNYFLDVLVRFGIVGFTAMCVWIWTLVKPAFQKRNLYTLALFGAFLIMSLTRVPHRMPIVYFYYFAVYFLNVREEEEAVPASALPAAA